MNVGHGLEFIKRQSSQASRANRNHHPYARVSSSQSKIV